MIHEKLYLAFHYCNKITEGNLPRRRRGFRFSVSDFGPSVAGSVTFGPVVSSAWFSSSTSRQPRSRKRQIRSGFQCFFEKDDLSFNKAPIPKGLPLPIMP